MSQMIPSMYANNDFKPADENMAILAGLQAESAERNFNDAGCIYYSFARRFRRMLPHGCCNFTH